jgi:Nucleotidyltransferase domain
MVTERRAVSGFDVVDPRYLELYERACSVLRSDPRVERVELSGSIAAGSADRWSDLDLAIFVRDDQLDGFLAEWPSWVAAITPTVFARTPIAPSIVNTVTDEGLTFDLVIRSTTDRRVPPQGGGYTVGMLSRLRFDRLSDALEYAVAEQLRGLAGPFISLVQREEHLRHLTGAPHVLGLLTTVFLAETGSGPPGKLWNETFTPEQRATVAGLPPVGATREAIVAFGIEVARLVVTRARPLYPRYGLEWPAPLAAVAAGRLADCLDIDVSEWMR